MLGSVEASDLQGGNGSADRAVVADFEAGIGTLTRMGPGDAEIVLIVAEPTRKSLEVAKRAAGLARERSVGRIVVVANRVRGDEDLDYIRAAFSDGQEIVSVPDDPAIVDADRRGVAPLDLTPDSPAVSALVGLVDQLTDGETA